MFSINSKYFSFFNKKPLASWIADITRDFLRCYSSSYHSFMDEIFIYDKKAELLFTIFMSYEACISYSINHGLFFRIVMLFEEIYGFIFVAFCLIFILCFCFWIKICIKTIYCYKVYYLSPVNNITLRTITRLV